ncbi:catechol 2,3-dioxygenase-like lactoylglutathione lyase family enzyme [Stackebrandtia albiflava]|uniref:Catechol 2,3-dioxygenase-like lactoylglutathione lyase family enzyme n=1 Tax=Stackebrandtia albiflava TaxID=406432 RepID=A0A562VED9_9ACTN|nr:VOC family protein [Stackebrandtia albiflava]TWJ16191.1 catechol 2,3-dioxygenase-like lactoylglutathione lyase family enzyme [Stackebrandtia albiflava]
MAGGFHHVELWVPDLARSAESWGWLLESLGWRRYQDWPVGRSWRHGDAYLVVEQSPALTGDRHVRTAPGLNHVALHAESTSVVDRLHEDAGHHGWTRLFPERYPFAGGDSHHAAYLSDRDGFEAEIVAPSPTED